MGQSDTCLGRGTSHPTTRPVGTHDMGTGKHPNASGLTTGHRSRSVPLLHTPPRNKHDQCASSIHCAYQKTNALQHQRHARSDAGNHCPYHLSRSLRPSHACYSVQLGPGQPYSISALGPMIPGCSIPSAKNTSEQCSRSEKQLDSRYG